MYKWLLMLLKNTASNETCKWLMTRADCLLHFNPEIQKKKRKRYYIILKQKIVKPEPGCHSQCILRLKPI